MIGFFTTLKNTRVWSINTTQSQYFIFKYILGLRTINNLQEFWVRETLFSTGDFCKRRWNINFKKIAAAKNLKKKNIFFIIKNFK